ncbi:MAG TPA: alkaline phosphatase family protein [Pyrinomonadaceae bacterium]|nr:alkaline phosphatase family protein [Pyrinomonadaceae bacterium]
MRVSRAAWGFVVRAALAAALLCACVPAGEAQSQRRGRARRVVIVSWDGAADWVLDRLLAEDKLPHLARLVRRGVRAEWSTPNFPSKTAPGHAAVWTGAFGDVSGVVANSVPRLPRESHTLLESRSGYSSEALLAEPIYVTAAKAGRRVVALSGTQVFPFGPHLAALRAAGVPAERFVAFSGFESQIERERVWGAKDLRPATGWAGAPRHDGDAGGPRELTLTIGETALSLFVFDDPADPVRGLDTVLVRRGAKADAAAPSFRLKPAEASRDLAHYSPPVRVTKGELFANLYLRLFELAPDGSRLALYQRAANAVPGTVSRREAEQYLEAYGGFHGDPFWGYADGRLGPPLWEGGDGTAERRALELVRLDTEFLKRGTRYAFRRWSPELLTHYTPNSDSAGHIWVGILDPASPAHDPALAARLWPFYEEVFRIQDEWLGEIVRLAGPGAVVCLVSDHGMEGVNKFISVDAVLGRAGLLGVDAEGRVELARTKATGGSDFFVRLNGTEWKGGIVPPSEREEVLRRAAESLLALVDPETGRHVITKVFRPEETAGLGIGGPAGGDLYFDTAPGYMPSSRYVADIFSPGRRGAGNGEHGFYPHRAKMKAVFFMAGPGVRRNVIIPGVRQIDIAPTLSRLLGIPAPKDARGHVVGDALVD